MAKIIVPENYDAKYGIMETEKAIKLIKDFFEAELSKELGLTRISAPLFVKRETGLNDNLNGVERPVSFEMKDYEGKIIEIIHSLAKWKRLALKRYKVSLGDGIYTDMNAIRRDEELDNTHSIYVDQWDWEKVITKDQRNIEFLKETVRKIYNVFLKTEDMLVNKYSKYKKFLPEKVTFITSQELENIYPNLSPEERENKFAKENGAIFIMQIGKILNSGNKHDGRAPDYDDWELNGDLIMWNPVLDKALELSSMGIRVDEKSLVKQLEILHLENRKKLQYHKMLLNGELPLTIGGGIGQSRICMFLLQKAHIGEVQASIWSDEIVEICEKNGINLL
ncbi:aspartate--ammonia ligase [Leptotrichia sp. OH3620_COT-345]|uniref:aspartate--ammonia ligase n=1 Tax=Leptotrichia sp. OH3620_COT-345 TaxID=2491048 RepID=UPI000F6537F5|nr:aspartate--ammonia ligase [Leptotrichia sp. OH3620_COT-345]RRD39076.1 aspartate--ammonia ligase [Leptotrichia sp. OH3620_COT-345]